MIDQCVVTFKTFVGIQFAVRKLFFIASPKLIRNKFVGRVPNTHARSRTLDIYGAR